jgi:hypothetical protein
VTPGGEHHPDLAVTVAGRFRDPQLERAVSVFAWYVERGIFQEAEAAAEEAFSLATAVRGSQTA